MIRKTCINGQCGLLLVSVLFFQAFDAGAQKVYRCNINGKIEFRQVACETGDETELYVTDQNGGLTPSEPGLRLRKRVKKTDKISRRKPNGASEKQCWNKQQKLERVERRLRSGYRASQYQSLHDRQREYEDFIQRFCRQ